MNLGIERRHLIGVAHATLIRVELTQSHPSQIVADMQALTNQEIRGYVRGWRHGEYIDQLTTA